MAYFIIEDWAGNLPFGSRLFVDFDEAEDYLSEFLGDNYDDDRGEYHIVEEGE